jgi:hypothetical protein
MALMKLAVLCVVVALASTVEEAAAVETEALAGVKAMDIGTAYWRVRSIRATQGKLEWAVEHLAFFTDRGATKAAAGGTPISSSTKVTKTEPDYAGAEKQVQAEKAKRAKTDKPMTGGEEAAMREKLRNEAYMAAKRADAGVALVKKNADTQAFDGKDGTYWLAGTPQKDEWIGQKFAAPQDIQSIKIKVMSTGQAPSAFIIEKSDDGENWSREIEVTNCKAWDKKQEVFAWAPYDTTPSSVFAIRSQAHPRFCVGVKPTPIPDDEEADPIPIKFGAKLTVQLCDDMKIPQWWNFDKRGMIHNSAGSEYIAHINATDSAVGSPFAVGECKKDCDKNEADLLQYSEGLQGGFLRLKAVTKNNLVLGPKDLDKNGMPVVGTDVVLHECGSNKDLKDKTKTPDANINNCPKMKHSQWELFPMFQIEKGKRALNCSPYSHTHKKPIQANDQATAQQACAKDNKCIAYNYRDSTPGDITNKAYLCWELHDVHSSQVGWELGIRAGRAEDFIEEEAAKAAQAKREL